MPTKIAVHISLKNESHRFLYQSMLNIAKKYSDVFIFIVVEEPILCNEKNIKIHSIGKQNIISFKYWHSFVLNPFLTKIKVDCFITNYKLCNPKIKIPQYYFIGEDLGTLKKNTLANIEKSKAVFVTEDFIAQQLENKIDKQKLKLVYYGLVEQSINLDYNQQKSIQGEFTNGYDYYLFYVDAFSAKHSISVLKAFSILKKWQKTSIKLLLLLDNVAELDLIPDFDNYKYKADVVFVNTSLKNTNNLIAASFAFIYLSDYKNINNLFFALQANVPAIVNNTETNNNIFKKSVLYTNTNEVGIAANMQQLYKDEQLKNELQIEAITILEKYDSDKTAEAIYETIKNNS